MEKTPFSSWEIMWVYQKKVENFTLRYGEKISLGKKPYLAAACITILNYMLDRKETPKS